MIEAPLDEKPVEQRVSQQFQAKQNDYVSQHCSSLSSRPSLPATSRPQDILEKGQLHNQTDPMCLAVLLHSVGPTFTCQFVGLTVKQSFKPNQAERTRLFGPSI